MTWILIGLALIMLHGFVVSFYFSYYKMTPKSSGTQMLVFLGVGILYVVILTVLLILFAFVHP